ncbi:MAG: LCP family protein [Nocardioidaceae bacterium]
MVQGGSRDDDDFDWLYGTSQKGLGASEPEPTKVIGPPVPNAGVPNAGPVTSGPVPSSPVPSSSGTSSSGTSTRPAPTPTKVTPPSGPGKPPKGKKKRRIRPLRIVLLLLIVWLAFLIAVPLFAYGSIKKVDAEPSGNRPAAQPGTTYLLVGSDSRAGLTKAQRKRLSTGGAAGRRTDTIMLLHTGSGPNLLMSIPRDSLVEVPGHGVTKVNAAYAYGGPKLLVRTLESATGIRIDNYVEIGFGGFVRMVNAVGGITICPKTAMKDPLAGLDIKAGCQSAHGKKALGYARSRHVSQLGDIDRAAHQREVVSQVGSKALSPLTILNPFRYYSLAFATADSLTVGKNVGPIDLARFALAMRTVGGDGSGLTCGVPISDLAVHWDTKRSERMFRLIREDRTDEIGKNLCQASGLPR